MASSPPTDLREGLKARLSSLDAAYEVARDRRSQRMRAADEQFKVETQQLQEERELVSKLLDIENRRNPDEIPESPTPPHFAQVTGIADFIVTALRATGPKTKSQLCDMAIDAGYRANGRIIHATVLNVMRGGRIAELQDGVFGIPPNGLDLRLPGTSQ